MKKCVISLNGIWQVRDSSNTSDTKFMLEAKVPGQIHDALIRAKIIPDPFWRDQAQQCQWVEDYNWCYKKEFEWQDEQASDWQVLECDGLDTFAAIRLNGEKIGRSENMFIPHRFDVTGKLNKGKNILEVYFQSHKRALADKPSKNYFSCFANDRVFARKMQCGFGWDWVHRLVTCGIWRPIRLVGYSQARIEDVHISTTAIHDNRTDISVELELEQRNSPDINALIALKDDNGNTVAEKHIEKIDPISSHSLQIDSPQLWWPNGHGDQPLYTCEVTLLNSKGDILDDKKIYFGIRTVELDMSPDEKGCSFILKINGKPIFCKGGNWVPADPFPARITVEKYERLITRAAQANINMLRCWGGGIYEPAEFWDACNRYGIMIMQDFMLACADYPEDDPAFMKQLEQEITLAIKSLRNQPSLIMWSGANELGMNSDPQSNYSGRKIAEQISGPLCEKLDPARPFLPTSPWGGKTNNDPTWGDSHTSAWYNNDFLLSDIRDYRQRINDCEFRFASESAIVGAPPLLSLRKFINKDDIFGPDKTMWEYRTKDNPYNGIDDMTHYDMLVKTANQLFGPTNDKTLHLRHMEYVQCEWIRLAMESARRRMFTSSGLLFWMYNDCWPASGWSMIDYYGFAKSGWYGMKRACAPVIAALAPIDNHVELWIVNDLAENTSVQYRLLIQPFSAIAEIVSEGTMIIPSNHSLKVTDFSSEKLQSDSILVCDVISSSGADRAVYYPGPFHDAILPKTKLHVSQTNNGHNGIVHIATDYYARVVSLEGDLDFSDNYFDLLPGESREITWTCPEGKFDGSVNVICWNQMESSKGNL
jgi:beta-mannosidase